jgi:glycosyltransferase involved in cell wall biosynthesis
MKATVLERNEFTYLGRKIVVRWGILRMSSPIDRIDVCIPTWNSGKTLERCLRSIIREIPVNCIRIDDNFSTDKTVQIAKKYGTVITQRKCGIGKARQYLIESVETEYFAFIDSDVVLRDGWFKETAKKVKSDRKMGVVYGLWLSDNPQDRHFWEVWWERVGEDNPMWERGYLIDTLIRTEAVKGISIPEWMTNYEDKFIKAYIVSGGYRWTVAKKAMGDHLTGETSFWKTCRGRRYLGAGIHLWADMDPNASMRKFLHGGIIELTMAVYASLKAKDPLIIPFRLLTFFYTLLGYVGSSSKLLNKTENESNYRQRFAKFKRN